MELVDLTVAYWCRMLEEHGWLVAFARRTKDHHHMDKTEPSKELTEDMTRESLIAISYRVPDADISAEMSPKKTNGEEVGETVVLDGEEKYRSELISISYSSPSPDVKVLPLLPVELDG